jgi:hypothetical protein
MKEPGTRHKGRYVFRKLSKEIYDSDSVIANVMMMIIK